MKNEKIEIQYDFEHSPESRSLKSKLLSHPYGSNPEYPDDLRRDIEDLIEIISQEFARVIEQIRINEANIATSHVYTVYRETKEFDSIEHFLNYAFCKTDDINRLCQALKYDDILQPMLYEFSHYAWLDSVKIVFTGKYLLS